MAKSGCLIRHVTAAGCYCDCKTKLCMLVYTYTHISTISASLVATNTSDRGMPTTAAATMTTMTRKKPAYLYVNTWAKIETPFKAQL